MTYIVKVVTIATEINTNFRGETHTYYHGKDGYVHDHPAFCDPWKRRRYAEKYIEESKEWHAHIDKSVGRHNWDYSYEIIEQ